MISSLNKNTKLNHNFINCIYQIYKLLCIIVFDFLKKTSRKWRKKIMNYMRQKLEYYNVMTMKACR